MAKDTVVVHGLVVVCETLAVEEEVLKRRVVSIAAESILNALEEEEDGFVGLVGDVDGLARAVSDDDVECRCHFCCWRYQGKDGKKKGQCRFLWIFVFQPLFSFLDVAK